MSTVPTRRPVRTTRSAKESENALVGGTRLGSRLGTGAGTGAGSTTAGSGAGVGAGTGIGTTTRAKSALGTSAFPSKSGLPTHTRAMSATTRAKAMGAVAGKEVGVALDAKGPIKRKREVLGEVTTTANNKHSIPAHGKASKEGTSTKPPSTASSATATTTATTAGTIKPKLAVKPSTAASKLPGRTVVRRATTRAPSESTVASKAESETRAIEPVAVTAKVKAKATIITTTAATARSKVKVEETAPVPVNEYKMQIDTPKDRADDEEERASKRRNTEERPPLRIATNATAAPIPAPTKPLAAVTIVDSSHADAEQVAFELQKVEESTEVQLWDDLDAEDWDDPVMVSEYVVDVCVYLKEIEQEMMPDPDYMRKRQGGSLTWEHRGLLIDWLLQIHARYNLLAESLFLTVNILDRFLSVKAVALAKLQLVGIASFFIATKFEETYAPSVKELVVMASEQYSVEEILTAERYILKLLNYDLKAPGPMGWLRRGSKADDCEVRARTVAKYLLEIACLDRKLMAYVPSRVAAAALWLSRLALGREEWTANLEHYTTYKEEELLPVANLMLEYIVTEPVQHESLYKKYSHKRYFRCSAYMREWALDRWAENSDIKLARDLPILKDEVRKHREQQALEEEARPADDA